MSETDPRTQNSPAEIYEAEQASRRTQVVARVQELWKSFFIRHIPALVLLLIPGLQATGRHSPNEQLVMGLIFTCGAAVWALSWITAIRLGIYVAKNNRLLRLWLIYLSWLPAAIVSAEALFVLEAFISS